MCEQNFVRFMDLENGNFGAILGHPIAIGFFVVAVAVVIFSVYNQSKINKREAANQGCDEGRVIRFFIFITNKTASPDGMGGLVV